MTTSCPFASSLPHQAITYLSSANWHNACDHRTQELLVYFSLSSKQLDVLTTTIRKSRSKVQLGFYTNWISALSQIPEHRYQHENCGVC